MKKRTSADPKCRRESHWRKARTNNGYKTKKVIDKRQGARKRYNGEALIVKTEASKYSEVLKAMRGMLNWRA